jgi:hypothetical protein
MQLPGFLRQDPSAGPEFPQDRASSSHATRGFLIGCLAALLFWFMPIPVAMTVWVFDLKGPFGDDMLMAIPFFLTLPMIGAGTGALFGRRRGTNSRNRRARMNSG